MLGFYVPPTAKVIRRRNVGLKSHPKDWRSPGSNSRPLVYKAGSLHLKVPACIFTLFPNKSACIYDNKHASKQIPWIDKFQNKKDIQLSLVNIMPFRVTLVIKRSLDQFAGVGSSLGHKNDMLCLPGVVFFCVCFFCLFFRKVSFVVRPNIRIGSNALDILEGT